MATKRIVIYKCPFCDAKLNRSDLVIHVEDDHEMDLPKDFTAFRYVFNYVNKKPLTYHGKCTECGGSTPWDESKGRYNRQCGKKACHDSFVKKFEENMVKTRGVTRMSATANGQVEMLANRKISGTYKFNNGKEKSYTGSYELKALEFMDKVMNINPDDLMCPGPILEYTFNNKTLIYITDFYYQPYNLIIEVKDGGDNPNKRNMPEYRAKQIAKEKYIIKHTNYNYLRLTNNNLEQLLSVFMDLKMQMVENTGERVIHVNESKDPDSPLHELMGMTGYGPVVGLKSGQAYITSIPQNNVFSSKSKYAVTDGELNSVFAIDDTEKLVKAPDELSNIIKQENSIYYNIGSVKEVSNKLKNVIDTPITESELYKLLTGITLYDDRQIHFNLESTIVGHINTIKLESYLLEGEFDSEVNNIIDSIREVQL